MISTFGLTDPRIRPDLWDCAESARRTFDYYRMIAGHATLAIDRHLFAFLEIAGVECKDYSLAHQLLTETATLLGRSPSSLDYSIWKYQSEGAEQSRCTEPGDDVAVSERASRAPGQ